MKYVIILIFISSSGFLISRASGVRSTESGRILTSAEGPLDSHGLHRKGKRIGGKSHSPGRLPKGIDAEGTISRRYCDRGPGKSCTSDDGKVTDKPQGVAAPAFEDEGDERVSYRDREMHESEVNENGKRMQETTTLGSTFSDKKTSPSISEGEEAGGDDAVNQDDGRSGDRPSGKIPRDESPEFIKKLEKIFLQFGDYILAMILKNLKLRLDQENLAEAYRRKIGVLTKENGGDSAEAGKIVERQIRDVFGEDFQLTLDRYLESFVERINLP